MLPIALGVVLGLLIGFAAGFAVARANLPAASGDTAAIMAPQGETPAQGGTPAQGQTGATPPATPGRPWSEQAVAQPPTAPPPVPDDAPASETKAAPAPTSGRIVVRSNPSNANVTVNGTWRGRTLLTLEKQAFGDYAVRVVREGYGVEREAFKLSADEPSRTVNVRLTRNPAVQAPRRAAPAPRAAAPATPTSYLGSIFVDSRPRGARVILDGKLIGTTPLRVPDLGIGSHVVRLELEDHRAWTSSTSVRAGEVSRVTGSLERIR